MQGTPRDPSIPNPYGLPTMGATGMCKYAVDREKLENLSTMKRGGTGDERVRRNSLL